MTVDELPANGCNGSILLGSPRRSAMTDKERIPAAQIQAHTGNNGQQRSTNLRAVAKRYGHVRCDGLEILSKRRDKCLLDAVPVGYSGA